MTGTGDLFIHAAPVLLSMTVAIFAGKALGIQFTNRKGLFFVILAISVLLTILPISGVTVSGYLLSLVPSYSLGSLFLLMLVVMREFNGTFPLSRKEALFFLLWNVSVSLLLYASTLGIISPDLYRQGYQFSSWLLIPAGIAIALFLIQSTLGFLFAGYIVCFHLGLFPSRNFFDGITDPLLFLFSSSILIYQAVKTFFPGRKIGHAGQV